MLTDIPDVSTTVTDAQWLGMILGLISWGALIGLALRWLTNRSLAAGEGGD